MLEQSRKILAIAGDPHVGRHREFGARSGNFAFYGALGGVSDDGFRELSPTHLRQAYGDFGYEDGHALRDGKARGGGADGEEQAHAELSPGGGR